MTSKPWLFNVLIPSERPRFIRWGRGSPDKYCIITWRQITDTTDGIYLQLREKHRWVGVNLTLKETRWLIKRLQYLTKRKPHASTKHRIYDRPPALVAGDWRRKLPGPRKPPGGGT